MSIRREYGRRVFILPRAAIAAARPFTRRSLPRNGRVLRVVGDKRGPVLRDYYGLF